MNFLERTLFVGKLVTKSVSWDAKWSPRTFNNKEYIYFHNGLSFLMEVENISISNEKDKFIVELSEMLRTYIYQNNKEALENKAPKYAIHYLAYLYYKNEESITKTLWGVKDSNIDNMILNSQLDMAAYYISFATKETFKKKEFVEALSKRAVYYAKEVVSFFKNNPNQGIRLAGTNKYYFQGTEREINDYTSFANILYLIEAYSSKFSNEEKLPRLRSWNEVITFINKKLASVYEEVKTPEDFFIELSIPSKDPIKDMELYGGIGISYKKNVKVEFVKNTKEAVEVRDIFGNCILSHGAWTRCLEGYSYLVVLKIEEDNSIFGLMELNKEMKECSELEIYSDYKKFVYRHAEEYFTSSIEKAMNERSIW